MEKIKADYVGKFAVKGQMLQGRVVLDGTRTEVALYSDAPFRLSAGKMRSIFGTTTDAKQITICDAVGSEESGLRHYYGLTKHFIDLFPHFVAIGPRHLNIDEKVVSKISFTSDGAIDLFYDLNGFGIAKVGNLRRFLRKPKKGRLGKIRRGQAFYYVDRGPLICVQSVALKVEVENHVSYLVPSPSGIQVNNEVRIHLEFGQPRTLHEAIQAIFEIRSFCEIITQSKHCVQNRSFEDIAFDALPDFLVLVEPRVLRNAIGPMACVRGGNQRRFQYLQRGNAGATLAP